MTSDFARLMKQDFSDLEAAAKAWRKLSQETDTLFDEHRTKVSGPLYGLKKDNKEVWQGKDASQAKQYMEDIEKRLNVVRTEAMVIAKAMDTARDWMEKAQQDLRRAVGAAEKDSFDVDDDGRITDRKTVEGSGDDPEAQKTAQNRKTRLQQYQQQMQQAVEDAKRSSDNGRNALAHLKGDILDRYNIDAALDSQKDVNLAMKALGIQQPEIPKDPKAAAAWWKGLSAADQQEFASLYPKLVGGTDGLPSQVRNDANRLALEQELDSLQPHRSADIPPDQLAERRKNLRLLDDMLDKQDGARAPRDLYLLGYHSSGDGRAIVAMGNPDKASHTGIYVPGTDTTMEDVPSSLKRIGELNEQATRLSQGAPVSTITWLGYDAPEKSWSVTNDDRAVAGGADLRNFASGLRASHENGPGHLTAFGHSYGSTTVGAAAADGNGLDVDNIVGLGSPGFAVEDPSELRIDPRHIYAGRSGSDSIAGPVAGTTLGNDPMDDGFGIQRFETGGGGHSDYWNDGGESVVNQGRIMVGQQPTQDRE